MLQNGQFGKKYLKLMSSMPFKCHHTQAREWEIRKQQKSENQRTKLCVILGGGVTNSDGLADRASDHSAMDK